MPKQPFGCLSAKLGRDHHRRLHPFRFWETIAGRTHRLFGNKERFEYRKNVTLIFIAEASLQLAGVDEFPSLTLGQIDAVELAVLFRPACNEEGVSLAA